MPSNKWAEWQIYMEAFQMGLIDRVEALKKTEIFDKEGVMQRTDEVEQLRQAVQQYEERVKDLEGDLQTARRESVSARQRSEVEKFKTRLSETSQKAKANTQVALGKLDNVVKLESEKLKKNGQAGK